MMCPNCITIVEHGIAKGVEQVRVRTIVACKEHQFRMKSQESWGLMEPVEGKPQKV